MALNAAVVWEVRPTASANMVGGGGFKTGASGVDYSQQDSPAWANLSVTSSAANAVMLTSSADSTMVGNIVRVVSGTNATVSWFEITSVSAGVSITVDRVWCSAAVTNGVVNIGGALNFGAAENTWAAALAAGNKVWVKSGSYSIGQSITTGTNATVGSPIQIIGYTSTRGDACSGTDRPVLDFAAFTWTAGIAYRFENFDMKGSGSQVFSLGQSTSVYNCKFTNYSTTVNRSGLVFNNTNTLAYNCEAISYRGRAFNMGSLGYMINCYAHTSAVGVYLSSNNPSAIINCIVESNSTAAIQSGTTQGSLCLIMGNTLYGGENKTGIGIDLSTGASMLKIFGNIIYGFTTGLNSTDAVTSHKMIEDYNCYYNCTTVNTNFNLGPNSISSTNPGFSGVAQITGTTATTSGSVLTQTGADFSNVVDNQDFCYIVSGSGITSGQYKIVSHTTNTLTLDIAPGTSATADKVFQITTGHDFTIGSALKAKGFPAAFPAIAANISYVDPGALQRQESAEGSGNTYSRGRVVRVN